MSFNIVDAVEAKISPAEVTRIAESSGDNPSKTRLAMSTGVLAVVGSIAQRAKTPAGAASLLSALRSLQSSPSREMAVDAHTLLGEPKSRVSQFIESEGGVSRGAADGILASVLPIVSSILGREMLTRRLDASGLSEFLSAQKRLLMDRPDASPTVARAFGESDVEVIPTPSVSEISVSDAPVVRPLPTVVEATPKAPPPTATATKKPVRGTWLALLALGAVAIGALLLYMGRRAADSTAYTSASPAQEGPTAPAQEVPAAPPRLVPVAPEEPPPPAAVPTSETSLTGAELEKKEPRSAEAEREAVDGISEYFQDSAKHSETFTLPGISFAFNSMRMEPGGEATLERLAALMNEHPSSKLLLEGHTDSVGDRKVNAKLSYDRASVVRRKLMERGVDGERISIAGKRDLDPVASNADAEGRAMNRRIDARVLHP